MARNTRRIENTSQHIEGVKRARNPNWLAEAKEKFVTMVDMTEGCWLWTGKRNAKGYGYFYLRPGNRLAHRAAVELWGQIVPNGACVRHRCDNPPCVNPDHLVIGTQADNIHDCMAKGRHVPPPPRCKLTLEQVDDILTCSEGNTATARRFGISREQVRRLRNGTSRVEICGKRNERQ